MSQHICRRHLLNEIPVFLGLHERVAVGDGVANDEALATAHVLLNFYKK
jgi:hypothetical protein